MNTLHSYEDWGRMVPQYVPESYNGSEVVQWYGNIERQLDRMHSEAEQNRNHDYANKLRAFLTVWRDNELTGSLNRETIVALKSGTEVLAVDEWGHGDYFSNLRDQLRRLLASEEALPPMDEDPLMGGGSIAGGMDAPPGESEYGPGGPGMDDLPGEDEGGDMPGPDLGDEPIEPDL